MWVLHKYDTDGKSNLKLIPIKYDTPTEQKDCFDIDKNTLKQFAPNKSDISYKDILNITKQLLATQTGGVELGADAFRKAKYRDSYSDSDRRAALKRMVEKYGVVRVRASLKGRARRMWINRYGLYFKPEVFKHITKEIEFLNKLKLSNTITKKRPSKKKSSKKTSSKKTSSKKKPSKKKVSKKTSYKKKVSKKKVSKKKVSKKTK